VNDQWRVKDSYFLKNIATMKDEYLALELVKNEQENRFEMNVEGNAAIIEYKEYPGKIALLHTEVPAALEGKGAATAIIEKTLAWLEENHFKLVPLCPFVVAYLKRHPEWNRLTN
jgi:predicted GNAT family acetyltransferase